MSAPRKLRKLLIANRGEIAMRVIRAAKELGIRTVAIYSDPDRSSPFVLHADECYPMGGALSKETYLDPEKILRIARDSQCDAVHPGYGFLSENYHFAGLVEEAGLIFVGPPAKAIQIMGGKTSAREAVVKHGVPIVPGTLEPIASLDEARNAARRIGFPVLIKAAGGGGGKGMRIAESEDNLQAMMERARAESEKAFADDRIYLEKYLSHPKHVEIQIMADKHGKSIYLGERECSIQRRHQKVVEESPSPALTPELRSRMGAAALKVVQACGYENAGTVEFLLDGKDDFFFLEMNTRLQVEHPVTEMVYGVDLVKMQLRVSQGEHLAIRQEDLVPNGHAIECRICAEEPFNDFLPSSGTITTYAPSEGPGVRNDSGVRNGTIVSHLYDPLLAKLIVWGEDRREAIARMERALREYRICGVETTIPFCLYVLRHAAFREGRYDIRFVEDHFASSAGEKGERDEVLVAGLVAAMLEARQGNVEAVGHSSNGKDHNSWRSKRFEE